MPLQSFRASKHFIVKYITIWAASAITIITLVGRLKIVSCQFRSDFAAS